MLWITVSARFICISLEPLWSSVSYPLLLIRTLDSLLIFFFFWSDSISEITNDLIIPDKRPQQKMLVKHSSHSVLLKGPVVSDNRSDSWPPVCRSWDLEVGSGILCLLAADKLPLELSLSVAGAFFGFFVTERSLGQQLWEFPVTGRERRDVAGQAEISRDWLEMRVRGTKQWL